MLRAQSNQILFYVAVLSLAGIGIALISQYVFGMQPCAWCVLQRLILLAIALICILGMLARRSRSIHTLAATLVCILGISGMIAAWYQYSVASQMFSCEQTFADKFIAGSGLDAALPQLFGIYATCMDARVSILGIEYALWSLGLFGLCVLLGLMSLSRSTRPQMIFGPRD
ncbi:disulfide bond formation protein B [Alcaligenaceae bacterium CGII-47]|nr:disulfide bond formation protein B [Alcaligenaceae bacterium CGII-47]